MTLGYYFQSLNTVPVLSGPVCCRIFHKICAERAVCKFILLILPTATIHKSVLLVIPVYILAALPETLAACGAGGICLQRSGVFGAVSEADGQTVSQL